MSAVNKWSSLDYGRTAHWWLGNEGTACGLDFHQDIRHADVAAPLCQRCRFHPAAREYATTRSHP